MNIATIKNRIAKCIQAVRSNTPWAKYARLMDTVKEHQRLIETLEEMLSEYQGLEERMEFIESSEFVNSSDLTRIIDDQVEQYVDENIDIPDNKELIELIEEKVEEECEENLEEYVSEIISGMSFKLNPQA